MLGLGLVAGTGVAYWVRRLCRYERQLLAWPPASSRAEFLRSGAILLVTAGLFAGFHWAVVHAGILETPEVQPSGLGRSLRLGYHLALICLLIAATAVDFDCYVIPDQITVPGVLLGVGGAVLSGELQICHWWVDWHLAIPQLRGPGIPAWFDTDRGWHALAWSLTGLVAAAGLTAGARSVSSWVLGQEAMGLGDITLMAMIGSFLGWQASVLAFLIAPLFGLTVGLTVILVSGRSYLPYGPWLSGAAVFVLFRWGWLWERTRLIFSDPLGLSILAVAGAAALVGLLLVVRLYRLIPGRVRS